MEISDDYAKHCINCSESRRRRTRPEIRAGQWSAVCLPRTGQRASCHVHAWLSRQRLVVSKADAGLRGGGISRSLTVPAPTEIPADGMFDPIALGKDLLALIAALSDDGQACVVGMDWGGTSTFQALATAPSAIKAAVVMNTAHPISILSHRKDPEYVRSVFHVFFFKWPALTRWSISRDFLSSIISGSCGRLHSRMTSISVRSSRRSALPVP